MLYQNKFENFIDHVVWTKNDPCIWVVYPAGAAGDLVASIINFHYANSGCQYFGIEKQGQVKFRPADGKLANFQYKDLRNLDQFVHDVNSKIGEKHCNYSMMDQVLFSNHRYSKSDVRRILTFFPKAKVVRILPNNKLEHSIVRWLSLYKNNGIDQEFKMIDNIELNFDSVDDMRVLEIEFGNLFAEQRFETTYDKIIRFLELPYKLVRFDLIEFWIQQQHGHIIPVLRSLKELA